MSSAIKRRIAKLAAQQETTPHAFMVTAIEEKIEAEEARAAFLSEAEQRLAQMEKTGEGIPAEEVFDYLMRRAEGKPARRPRARKIS
jgi:predicted transcriptional regulator